MNPSSPPLFTGCATALITPFKDGKVDFPAFEHILQDQMHSFLATLLLHLMKALLIWVQDKIFFQASGKTRI